MQKCITVSSIIILSLLLSCTANKEETKQEKEQGYGPESLLLPEHRDTTTVYNVLPDSIFEEVDYNETETFNGITYKKINFLHLAKTRFTPVADEESGDHFLHPHFSDEVKTLSNQNIMIKGFFLPLGEHAELCVLSRNTYRTCFFCGNAGPETVIELKFDKPLPEDYGLDQILTVGGELVLNSENTESLCYILRNAEILKEH